MVWSALPILLPWLGIPAVLLAAWTHRPSVRIAFGGGLAVVLILLWAAAFDLLYVPGLPYAMEGLFLWGPTSLALCGAAHAQQKVRINLANAFPNSLTLIGEAPVKLAQKLNRISAGTLELRVNEPGALVPALQAIQATGQGSVDAAWSNAGFFAGTDSAFNMFAAVPFGPAIPEYLAWIHHGGALLVRLWNLRTLHGCAPPP